MQSDGSKERGFTLIAAVLLLLLGRRRRKDHRFQQSISEPRVRLWYRRRSAQLPAFPGRLGWDLGAVDPLLQGIDREFVLLVPMLPERSSAAIWSTARQRVNTYLTRCSRYRKTCRPARRCSGT